MTSELIIALKMLADDPRGAPGDTRAIAVLFPGGSGKKRRGISRFSKPLQQSRAAHKVRVGQ